MIGFSKKLFAGIIPKRMSSKRGSIMSKICLGCGVKLQTNDKNKDGYIREDKYDTSIYCERCFKMMHYGEYTQVNEPKSIDDIVSSVNKNAKYVVFMSDFINIFDRVVDIFKSIKTPKTLVISKSDIIPKNVSFEEIKNYLRITYGIKDNIVFTNNKTNLNTFIKELYGHDEVYFLGLTNSGKSTLINEIMDKYGSTNARITTSYKENTTMDFIRIKVGNMTLVDSPGFLIDNFSLAKNTLIDREIHPITYQNKTNCTYNIGNLFNIKLTGLCSATFYFSNHIDIKRLYNKETIGLSFTVKGNSDIVICGLGFIKVNRDVTICIPESIMKYINIRPSITGGSYGKN